MSFRLLSAAAVTAVLFALPASAFASRVVETAMPAPGKALRLSDERKRTLSANPQSTAIIHRAPKTTSRKVARLRWQTEDGFAEVYLVLKAYTDADGVEWTQIRVPGRPNGRTGWVQREDLGPFSATNLQLVVNRRHRTITLYRNGKRRWQRPVGIGKPVSPTPRGHYWIRERFKLRGNSPYGPYALGTAAYSVLTDWPGGGVVGIHGDWNLPKLIPGRPSHGCIRLHDRDVRWLAPRIDIGTPLRIV
jgi:hypothetical protein